MRYGRAITILLCLGSACAGAAQDDIPIVEPPLPELPEGTRLEDVPEVDELPDWLIDIPPERRGATPSDRVVMQYEQADERVVSTSHMFAVSGGDAARMGAIAAHADELRVRLNQLLHLDSKWKFPIAIRVIGTTADAATPRPIRPQVQLLGDTPSLQLRIFAGGGISLEKLDAAIITLLLYEYAMRDIRPDALPDYLTLPPWLITGIQQAIFWKQDRVDRRLYQNLFNHTEMLAPEDIMESGDPEKMDAASRQLFEVSCGVLIMNASNCEVSHSEIADLTYTGISVGWVWGYADSATHHNRILKNHIHDLGKGVLSDMGGIYLLGRQPGTIVAGNVIHDVKSAHYGGWALYTDEGSSGITLEGNLCYNVSENCYHQHYGSMNTVRGNIFAFPGVSAIYLTRAEEHLSIVFTSNVFLTRDEPAFKLHERQVTGGTVASYGNFYAGVGEVHILNAVSREKPMTYAEATARGFDTDSVIIDDPFVDAEHYDFRLREPIPGFSEIPMPATGPFCDKI